MGNKELCSPLWVEASISSVGEWKYWVMRHELLGGEWREYEGQVLYLRNFNKPLSQPVMVNSPGAGAEISGLA